MKTNKINLMKIEVWQRLQEIIFKSIKETFKE